LAQAWRGCLVEYPLTHILQRWGKLVLLNQRELNQASRSSLLHRALGASQSSLLHTAPEVSQCNLLYESRGASQSSHIYKAIQVNPFNN
jgi:DNA-binding HxlR family transcriptional regulator